jgi:hypothetical protein
MATTPSSPTPQNIPAPPPIPNDPKISNALTNYLTQFSLWCRKNFNNQVKTNVAVPGILMYAANPPAGVNPNVYMIQVSQAGVIAATPVPVGGANPSQ